MGLLFSKLFQDFPKKVYYNVNDIDGKKYKIKISGFETRKYMKEVRKVFEKNKLDETLKKNKNGKTILEGCNLIKLLSNPYVLVSKELLTTTKSVCLSIYKDTTFRKKNKKNSNKKVRVETDIDVKEVFYPRYILKLIKKKYEKKSNKTEINLTKDLGLTDTDIKSLFFLKDNQKIDKKIYTLSELRKELSKLLPSTELLIESLEELGLKQSDFGSNSNLLPSTELSNNSIEKLGLNQSDSGFNLNYFMLQLDVKNPPIDGEFNNKSILNPKLVKKLILKNKNLTKTCSDEDKKMYQKIIDELDERINIFNIIQAIYNKFQIPITYQDYDAYGLLKISKLNLIIEKLMTPLNKTKYKLLNSNKNKKEEVNKNLNKLKKYLYYNKIIKCFYQIEETYFKQIIDFINIKDKKLIYSVYLLILELQNKINDYFNDNPRKIGNIKTNLEEMPNTNDKKKLKQQLDIIKQITSGKRIIPLTETERPLKTSNDHYIRLDNNTKIYLFNLLTIWSELCCNNILMNDIISIYREQFSKIENINKFYSLNGKLNYNNVFIKDDYIYFYEKFDIDYFSQKGIEDIRAYIGNFNRSIFNTINSKNYISGKTLFYSDENDVMEQIRSTESVDLNNIFNYNKITDIKTKCQSKNINEKIDCDYYKILSFCLHQGNSATLTKFATFFMIDKYSPEYQLDLNNRDFVIIKQRDYLIFIILYDGKILETTSGITKPFGKLLQISFFNEKNKNIINYCRIFDLNKEVLTIPDIEKYLEKQIKQQKGGSKKSKSIRKHRGIYQSGSKAGKLRPGFKYTGERTKTGLKVIAEIKK